MEAQAVEAAQAGVEIRVEDRRSVQQGVDAGGERSELEDVVNILAIDLSSRVSGICAWTGGTVGPLHECLRDKVVLSHKGGSLLCADLHAGVGTNVEGLAARYHAIYDAVRTVMEATEAELVVYEELKAVGWKHRRGGTSTAALLRYGGAEAAVMLAWWEYLDFGRLDIELVRVDVNVARRAMLLGRKFTSLPLAADRYPGAGKQKQRAAAFFLEKVGRWPVSLDVADAFVLLEWARQKDA